MTNPTNYHEIQTLKHEQIQIFQRLSRIEELLKEYAHTHKHYVETPLKDSKLTPEPFDKAIDGLTKIIPFVAATRILQYTGVKKETLIQAINDIYGEKPT